MARHNVYLKDKIENEIKDIISLEIQNGASKSEMNVSSMVNELCRLGLMIYKSSEDESSFNLENYRRDLIKKSSGSREGVMLLVSMMTELYLRGIGETNRDNLDEAIDAHLTSINAAEDEAEKKHFVVE